VAKGDAFEKDCAQVPERDQIRKLSKQPKAPR